MNALKYISLVILFTCGIQHLSAQTELPTGKIEVVKDFEVRLTETKKIRIIPSPVSIDSTARKYEYRLLAPSPSIEYVVPEIKPLAITPEQKPIYYPFYAKAGYGSPNSFFGALTYDHKQSAYFNWGVDVRHLSANNKKIPLHKFSDSRGRLHGTYLLTEKLIVGGYLDGHYEKLYFYGAEEIPTNPESLKRSFNRYDLNVEVSNDAEKTPLSRYKALLNYTFDKDDLGSKERALRIGGEGELLFGDGTSAAGAKLIADLSKFQHTEEHPLNNLSADVYLSFIKGNLGIHLGGGILLNKADNELLPDFKFSYQFLDGLMSLYAGWGSIVQKNNFHFLSSYNPYIHTRLDSINNHVVRKIFGGIKGNVGAIQFDAEAAYNSFERLALFVQDNDAEHQFNPLYEDGSFVSISGSVGYDVWKNVALKVFGYTRFYDLDTEEKPWYRPSTGLDAVVSYDGAGDIYHFALIFHAENGLPYRTVGGSELRLDPLLHLNLHADYFFTSAFGAFLELNNILGNNRERWLGYPSFGFNAKAGLNCRI